MKTLPRSVVLILLLCAAVVSYLVGGIYGVGLLIALGLLFELGFWFNLFKKKKDS